MEKYIAPNLEILAILKEDIITTSVGTDLPDDRLGTEGPVVDINEDVTWSYAHN